MVLNDADDKDTFLKNRATSSKQDSSGKQKRGILLDCLPKSARGLVLITSRFFPLATVVMD